jgi:predicted RNA binding protein YcfA (HicA-like mRNA interferase family)
MPRLGVFSGDEVCRILEGEGFRRVRQRGSHIVMQRRTDQGCTTVPVPDHRTIRIGTLQAIIRQSGLAKEKFMR